MRALIQFILIAGIAYILISCDKPGNKLITDDIIFRSINKEFVLIRDSKIIFTSEDEISQHIDSICSGLIQTEFISTGLKSFDLNFDNNTDINFEIIGLNKFNQNKLPDYFDSLAARVHPVAIQILDNSTYGYPDALNTNDPIGKTGNWSDRICVLGTFMNAGKFQGKGEKYLGFRFNVNNNYQYGWIKLYCSNHNDTLRIIECAYNQINDLSILAGQKE